MAAPNGTELPYRVREGVVTTKICRTTVLIPCRSISEHCRAPLQLRGLWAETWHLINAQKPLDQILTVHRILTKRSDAEIWERLDRFCADLADLGFLQKRLGTK